MKKKIKRTKKTKKAVSQHLKILAVGDLHGDITQAKKLAKKAKKEKVDLVVLLGDLSGLVSAEEVVEPFKEEHQKVIFIPGNWDTSIESRMIQDIHKIKNLDGYYAIYKGVGLVGVGISDFRLSLDDEKILKKIDKNFKKIRPRKKILISHLHPQGSKSEFSGIPGEPVLRKAIKYFKPDLFLHSHIHEAEGIEEKIGRTKVINVGKKGKIIKV